MDPNVDAAVNAARYRLLFADAPDKRVMLVPDAGHVLLRAAFNDQIASDWTLWKAALHAAGPRSLRAACRARHRRLDQAGRRRPLKTASLSPLQPLFR